MQDTKAWYQSKTVWGAIVTLVSMVTAQAGMPVEPADQQSIVEMATTAGAALGGIIALVGRLSATARVR